LLALLTMPTTTAPAAAGEPGSVPFLQVRLDRVTPDLVTTTSDPTLTVTATVTNVGDRPVRDVVARLEHAPAVTSSAGLRTNLDGGTDQYQPVGEFVNVSGELQRGQAVEVAFAFPIRSTTALAGHRCTRRLPLLVNVNGTPDYGEPARLDDARFLLPVLGAPPIRLTGATPCPGPWPPTPPARSRSPCCGRWPTGRGWRPACPAAPPRCG
jgi:hypothetical protein